ncbi:glutamate receptor U1-like [Chelonus insularis]|uniref:glutamate receptor U1-like n=1 Tax=Chelonus insularis TaxID=460826 RepID=UPI0015889A0E|nr:glutamate receptor U1-like [Chelonus insularis]
MINPDTLNHLSDFADKKIDGVTKANYFWIQHLVQRMNATMTLTWENTWGYQDQNGTWNGMIGLLDRGQIDFGGTATFLIPQRLGVIDYIQLYTPVCSRFIFKKPPLSYVKNLFTLPFNRLVWYAISLSICAICGFLYLVLKWEWKHTRNKQSVFQYSGQLNNDPNLSDNLLILIGALFQQGSSYEPRNISAKIVILMLLILSLSLYASYTAKIVALLQSTTSSINTVQDLIKSGLKIGIYDVVYNRYYFQAVQDPMRKNFYKNYVENKTSIWMSLDEGIEKVRKGLFAFHADATASYSLIQETYEEEEKCGLHEFDYLNLLYPMLVLPLDSPYREIFRVGALWIKETGLQQRTNRRLFTQKPTCAGQTSFVSVGTIDCYAAFLIIFYGVFIALGFLLMELIHFQCSRYINSNQVKNVKSSVFETGTKMIGEVYNDE